MKTKFAITCLLTLLTCANAFAETSAEKGYRIMAAVDKLPVLERSLSENTFKIYDAQGKLAFTKKARSARLMENYNNANTRLSRALSYFYSPSDDKGNAALMIEVSDGEDDQWLYLKGLRKPKRVLGSDKSSSFMGSDFSNGDVSPPDLDESDYHWLASEKIEFKGREIGVEKIEIAFKDRQKREDYGYSKSIIWVHPASGMAFKGDIYDLQGQLYKQMSLTSFQVNKNRDGKKIFTTTGMEMRNVLKGTKTEMKISNLKTEGQAAIITPKIFSLQYLTRKWW